LCQPWRRFSFIIVKIVRFVNGKTNTQRSACAVTIEL